ncbi:MAG: DDE transposase family protein [Coleofasciculus sp. S288]|nr:DDE transposase family protein [Coleofasciculus sp. S288]
MENLQTWYIVKRPSNQCEILSKEQFDQIEGEEESEIVERWGPFDTQQDAIARRVGLIRAGKCQPV